MTNTKKMILTGLCIALGIILPVTLHSVPNAGSVFLPMHIPVLLCGLMCGWSYGLVCGILTPLLSSLLTGMPPVAYLPAMVCELAAYGLFSGILLRAIGTPNKYLNTYLSLIGAMLLGRVLYGVMQALIFSFGSYSMQLWVTASFVTALPGIIIQIVLIPPVIFTLKRAKLIAI